MHSQSAEEKKSTLRWMAKNDLYFLAKYILGYWWLCWEPHKEFAEEIQRDINLSLFLLPRGTCKTQLFNSAHTLQCYLRKPHEPIGIFCDSQKRASWKLQPLRGILERNEALKELFPDLLWSDPRRQASIWRENEIVLPGHNGSTQEPSIGCYGLDNQPTSLHFARVKGDDLVTPETCTTAEQIRKNKDQYGMMRSSILAPDGNIQICGTIYDDGDLHRDMEDSGVYRVFKRPAEWAEIDADGVKHKRFYWPVQLGPDALSAKRKDPAVSEYIYSCQFLLDPVPESPDNYFQLQWFPRYDYGQIKQMRRRFKFYSGADLAISERDQACETADVVMGLDSSGELYLIDVAHGHWDALTIVSNLLDVQARWRSTLAGIECENIARTIRPFLSLKMRETGVWMNVQEMSALKDKLTKNRPLQGRAREKAIWLPAKNANAPEWLFEVEYQLRKFPRGKLCDIVDSMGVVCRMLDKQSRPPDEMELRAMRDRDKYQPLDSNIGY